MAFGAETAELVVALRLDDKGFAGKLNNATRQLKTMDRNLAQMGRGFGQVGSGLDKIVTRGAIAAAAGLTGVITTAASFEQAWAGVTKTVEGANEALLNDFKQLSREVPLSFEELAAIGAEGGALGIATKDLIEFTDIVARLAVSTDLSAEAASSALGHLSNVLDLDSGELRDFSDALVALGNDGASTESEIIGLAERFGAAAHQAGLSSEATLALASATASMGIEAEAGGGALSRIFNGITLDIANASDESEVLAESMGMSLAELRAAWDKDAGAVFGELLSTLKELDKFERVELLSDLGVTNSRDIAAITALADGAEEYNRQLGVATGQTDELNRESDAFFNTTEGKWEILKNNVRLAADSIGSRLLPIVNELGDEFVTWLSDPKVQRGIEDFAEGLAGGIRDIVKELREADFGPLISTLKGAAEVAKIGFDAFNALPSGVKSLALAAFGINKLTGGALTDIAKGFGNIFGAGLKILFERGSPTNPMFVVPLGGKGIGGIGGGLAGGAGGGLAGAGRLIGGAFAVTAAAAMANEFKDEIQGLGKEMSQTLFPGGAPLEGLGDALGDLQWPFGPKNAPAWARFDAPPPKQVFSPGEKGGRTGAGSVGGSFADDVASLDLASNEVIERLRGTTEIGLKGLGTSFQVGLQTGLDPVGDTATRILARAENPKDPPVMTEIKGHIAGLEEIQATYLATGDVRLATKVQTNIDTLHSLIGTTDTSNAILSRVQSEAASADAVLKETSRRTASAAEITSRKSFSPKVSVNNNITVPVGISIHEQNRVTFSANRAYSDLTVAGPDIR